MSDDRIPIFFLPKDVPEILAQQRIEKEIRCPMTMERE